VRVLCCDPSIGQRRRDTGRSHRDPRRTRCGRRLDPPDTTNTMELPRKTTVGELWSDKYVPPLAARQI
jgi:hypothetical protein